MTREVSKPHSEHPDLIEQARDLAGHGSAPMYDHLLYSLADALAETQETIRGFEGVVRNYEEIEKRLEEQLETAREAVQACYDDLQRYAPPHWRNQGRGEILARNFLTSFPAKTPPFVSESASAYDKTMDAIDAMNRRSASNQEKSPHS